MIKVNAKSIEYYKNGVIVHTQPNSGGSRVGGVTNFVRKLVLGKSSNNANSTYTIRKLNCGSNPNNLNYVAQNTDGSVLTPMCPGALPGAVLVH